jgi:hypothetical protein
MRLAVIADIHGNLPVRADIARRGADRTINNDRRGSAERATARRDESRPSARATPGDWHARAALSAQRGERGV